jgi:thiol:disulfide interchange protein DsbA
MLDKDFDTWSDKQSGKDVVIYHYPVVFNKAYEALARAYYTVLALPSSKQLDNDVYDALHNKGINLTQEDNLQRFFAEHGVPADKFSGIYNSFGLDMKIKRARDLSNAFHVTNTPYIVVNSQVATYATSWAMANSKEKLFAILDYLIAKDVPQATTIHN